MRAVQVAHALQVVHFVRRIDRRPHNAVARIFNKHAAFALHGRHTAHSIEAHKEPWRAAEAARNGLVVYRTRRDPEARAAALDVDKHRCFREAVRQRSEQRGINVPRHLAIVSEGDLRRGANDSALLLEAEEVRAADQGALRLVRDDDTHLDLPPSGRDLENYSLFLCGPCPRGGTRRKNRLGRMVRIQVAVDEVDASHMHSKYNALYRLNLHLRPQAVHRHDRSDQLLSHIQSVLLPEPHRVKVHDSLGEIDDKHSRIVRDRCRRTEHCSLRLGNIGAPAPRRARCSRRHRDRIIPVRIIRTPQRGLLNVPPVPHREILQAVHCPRKLRDDRDDESNDGG